MARTIDDVYDILLSAAHLRGQSYTMKIEAVAVEPIRQASGDVVPKILLTLANSKKRLALNKTQAVATSVVLATEQYEDWVGQTIQIGPKRLRTGKLTIEITTPPTKE